MLVPVLLIAFILSCVVLSSTAAGTTTTTTSLPRIVLQPSSDGSRRFVESTTRRE